MRKQVVVMREIYARCMGDVDKCVEAYAKAELAGEVPRKSNKHNISAHRYARSLYRDGIRKGWLP